MRVTRKAIGLGLTFLLLAGCGQLGETGNAQGATLGWETDFARASARAKESGKYMLLDFSGSDWCGWCVRLEKEVFSQEQFRRYAADNLVCVLLDFPRRKAQSPEVKKQNQKLSETYGIKGFPTVLVLSPDGELVGKTGYRPGGAEAYVQHLKAMIDPHRARR